MSVRNERFNRRMVSFDALDGKWLEKIRDRSDGGMAVERMLGRADIEDGVAETPWEQSVADDVMLLMFRIFLQAGQCEYLERTLLLIAENVTDREESQRVMRLRNNSTQDAAERLYERHRGLLERMFIWTRKDGAFLDLENSAFRFRVTDNIEGHDGGEVPSQEPL